MIKNKKNLKENKNNIAFVTSDTNVRRWYHKEYPTDPEWKSLEDFTFYDVFYLLDNYYCPDFGDSIIRERIFQKLANIMDVDLHYIYEQWINSKKQINMTKYDFDCLTWDEFQNANDLLKESYLNGYRAYDKANKNYDDVYYQLYYTLDELYCDGKIDDSDLRRLKSGRYEDDFKNRIIKIALDTDGSLIDTEFGFRNSNEKDFYQQTLKDAARNYLSDIGIKENWRVNATEEDIERFRNRHNELKNDTKRKHGWLYFPRSSEDIIADSQDEVADQVYDFIETHKQYFAPDSGIYNRGYFYVEKKFNSGMGRTRLCKIDPKTKTIYLTNVANRFDIKYLEESFPKYKIEKDEKYSPWDRKSW